jgi:hypothetical protein
MASSFVKTIDLDFVHIKLYENYLISTIKEGVVFDKPHLERLYKILNDSFPGQYYGYISDRKFDYTVNPTCYLKSETIHPNLLGIAVHCYNSASYNNAQFERNFYHRPMDTFYTLDQCKEWVNKLIESKKEKAGL